MTPRDIEEPPAAHQAEIRRFMLRSFFGAGVALVAASQLFDRAPVPFDTLADRLRLMFAASALFGAGACVFALSVFQLVLTTSRRETSRSAL